MRSCRAVVCSTFCRAAWSICLSPDELAVEPGSRAARASDDVARVEAVCLGGDGTVEHAAISRATPTGKLTRAWTAQEPWFTATLILSTRPQRPRLALGSRVPRPSAANRRRRSAEVSPGVTGWAPGAPVVVEPTLTCRGCVYFRTADSNRCADLFRRDDEPRREEGLPRISSKVMSAMSSQLVPAGIAPGSGSPRRRCGDGFVGTPTPTGRARCFRGRRVFAQGQSTPRVQEHEHCPRKSS